MRSWILIFATTAALAVAGCSNSTPNSADTKEVVISSLLKDFGLGSNITRITLGVSGGGFESFTRETVIEDGVATFVLDVPIGEDRVFEMTAFNQSNTAMYNGSDTADVLAGSQTEVNIKMTPLLPMIRVSRMFTQTLLGSEESIRIVLHNVDSLFGTAFRVEYDSTILDFVQVTEGNAFSGRPNLFFTQNHPGYVAVGYSLRGTQTAQGVDIEEANLAVIRFKAKRVGTTNLEISATTLNIIDWQGEELPRQGQLYIENGEMQVNE